MLKNVIFVFSFFILYINCFNFNPEEFKCDHQKIDKLKVGDEVILCIHTIDPNTNSTFNQNKLHKKKFAISIKVDDYSILSVDGIRAINNENDNGNKDLELLAQINEVTSVFATVSI